MRGDADGAGGVVGGGSLRARNGLLGTDPQWVKGWGLGVDVRNLLGD